MVALVAGEVESVASVVSRVMDHVGMRETDPDDQECSDQQPKHGSDHRLGTRDLDLLDVLILH